MRSVLLLSFYRTFICYYSVSSYLKFLIKRYKLLKFIQKDVGKLSSPNIQGGKKLRKAAVVPHKEHTHFTDEVFQIF